MLRVPKKNFRFSPPENLEQTPPPENLEQTPPRDLTHTTPHPPVDRILDTRFWKYYLGPTSLRPVITTLHDFKGIMTICTVLYIEWLLLTSYPSADKKIVFSTPIKVPVLKPKWWFTLTRFFLKHAWISKIKFEYLTAWPITGGCSSPGFSTPPCTKHELWL